MTRHSHSHVLIFCLQAFECTQSAIEPLDAIATSGAVAAPNAPKVPILASRVHWELVKPKPVPEVHRTRSPTVEPAPQSSYTAVVTRKSSCSPFAHGPLQKLIRIPPNCMRTSSSGLSSSSLLTLL
ncbi:hypothetical protein M378DRAFT_156554, partial [Amanita muscaria Koide BX008]